MIVHALFDLYQGCVKIQVEAGEYTALEQSIQKYAEEPSKSVVKPELGLSFDLSGEAYDFYNLYSWVVGFGIRYGKSRLNDKRTKIMQEILSGCAVRDNALMFILFFDKR